MTQATTIATPGIRTYVIDTSVLLSDPRAVLRFDEHQVVLPVVVLTELEAKRHHPELGYFARSALRLLDEIRDHVGRLDQPVPVGRQGGTLRVELNCQDESVLPRGLRLGDNDTRILAVAATLASQGADVAVVSKDLPMRLKAASIGLHAEEYRALLAVDSGWTGMREAHVSAELMAELYSAGHIAPEQASEIVVAAAAGPVGGDSAPVWAAGPDAGAGQSSSGQRAAGEESASLGASAQEATASGTKHDVHLREEAESVATLPVHTGFVLHSARGSALGRRMPDGSVKLVRGDREVFGIHGRSAEQRIALDLLADPAVGIVSLGGRAGTGKSVLALAAGLEAVMEQGAHSKVMVFRPLYAVGGQNLGYLPGSEGEKMNPWAQAVFDALTSITSQAVVDEAVDRGQLEVLPLTHIRGRSLHDAYVIVDEAQSLERNVLLTVLSRVGQRSKVVLTHDVAQRDNLRVGRHDGIAAVIEALKGKDLFAHLTLVRQERSDIAALVTELLDEGMFLLA